jgi:glycosyltransferase involved in cell wall biosynthesis
MTDVAAVEAPRHVRATDARIRVLAIAQDCNPEWESIPLVAWQHSQALARLTDLHLVTHSQNAENLSRAGLTEGKDFTSIDSSAVDLTAGRVLERLGMSWKSNKGWSIQTAVRAVSYQWFERLVWARFADDIRRGAYDVVHRLTPLSPVVPSLMARKCQRSGVPFVLGPLNGGLSWPKQFSNLRAKEREWLWRVREAYKLVPGYRSTRQSAAAIIAGSRATFDQIPLRYRDKVVYITENAVNPARFSRYETRDVDIPLQVVFVGRFVPVKGIDMLVEAAAPLLRTGAIELTLIGDGSEMGALRSLVEREGVAERVTFTGWVRHDDLQNHLMKAHIFGFPSVKDFGGGAVLEAMAMGLVPLVVDYGGPAEIVSPGTGFTVPLGTREDIITALRATLERLAANPKVLGPMAERARARVLTSFTWDAKASQVLEVYRWTLDQRDKPEFQMPQPDVLGAGTV